MANATDLCNLTCVICLILVPLRINYLQISRLNMNYNIKRLIDVDPVLTEKLKRYCYDLNGCCQIVHKDMGPFLNEYMYQDALQIVFEEKQIPYKKEFYFSVDFHGHRINHKHFVDFFVKDKVFIECKAIERIGAEQRQQLWNYMRLTGIRLGILYNFAPIIDQCEHYYFDTETKQMYTF